MQGSQTLGKTKKTKNSQRHSAGNIDYDNIQGSQEGEDVPIQVHTGFRVRSKTVGDSAGIQHIDQFYEHLWKISYYFSTERAL